MINRDELHEVSLAMSRLEAITPVGSIGWLEGDESDTLVQICEIAAIPTKAASPVDAKLTLVIAYRVVGKLPLGRFAWMNRFPKIYQPDLGGHRQKYQVAYLNLDSQK
jgi:hypothetical protein